ncbi:MAG: hypothetical protein M3130_07110 [Actinomycetota bacterium]|nr:hypothetical protein [Actinomycetota bacterium]
MSRLDVAKAAALCRGRDDPYPGYEQIRARGPFGWPRMARLEAQIAPAALATRMPRLRPAANLVRRITALIRNPLRQPVDVR